MAIELEARTAAVLLAAHAGRQGPPPGRPQDGGRLSVMDQGSPKAALASAPRNRKPSSPSSARPAHKVHLRVPCANAQRTMHSV